LSLYVVFERGRGEERRGEGRKGGEGREWRGVCVYVGGLINFFLPSKEASRRRYLCVTIF